jgi:hypothetical protein
MKPRKYSFPAGQRANSALLSLWVRTGKRFDPPAAVLPYFNSVKD